MNACVELLKATLQFFALDCERQCQYAPQIPSDGATPVTIWELRHSPLKEVVANIHEFIPWLEEELEGSNDEALRLVAEVSELLRFMQCVDNKVDLWSKAALRDRPIWNIVRRLSKLTVACLSWPAEEPQMSFECLVAEIRD